MNFYKHFIGDYQRSTGDLTIVEHGAFRLMLDYFYGTGRPLPQDKKALCRLLRAESDEERAAIETITARFWRQMPNGIEPLYDWLDLNTEVERAPLRMVMVEWGNCDGLINVRALGEMVKACVIAAKNKKTAIDREAAKRGKKEAPRDQP